MALKHLNFILASRNAPSVDVMETTNNFIFKIDLRGEGGNISYNWSLKKLVLHCYEKYNICNILYFGYVVVSILKI